MEFVANFILVEFESGQCLDFKDILLIQLAGGNFPRFKVGLQAPAQCSAEGNPAPGIFGAWTAFQDWEREVSSSGMMETERKDF